MAQVVATKIIQPSPAIAPGFGQTETLRRAPQIVRSNLVEFGDTASISLFEIPGNIAITNAWLEVAADFDGSGTSAAPSATLAVPVATGAQIILSAAALTLVTTIGAVATGPIAIVPASGGVGTLAYTPGTTTAGSMYVYLEYVTHADML
jgi:hypothetical protein